MKKWKMMLAAAAGALLLGGNVLSAGPEYTVPEVGPLTKAVEDSVAETGQFSIGCGLDLHRERHGDTGRVDIYFQYAAADNLQVLENRSAETPKSGPVYQQIPENVVMSYAVALHNGMKKTSDAFLNMVDHGEVFIYLLPPAMRLDIAQKDAAYTTYGGSTTEWADGRTCQVETYTIREAVPDASGMGEHFTDKVRIYQYYFQDGILVRIVKRITSDTPKNDPKPTVLDVVYIQNTLNPSVTARYEEAKKKMMKKGILY